jgi:hypothetical protein
MPIAAPSLLTKELLKGPFKQLNGSNMFVLQSNGIAYRVLTRSTLFRITK